MIVVRGRVSARETYDRLSTRNDYAPAESKGIAAELGAFSQSRASLHASRKGSAAGQGDSLTPASTEGTEVRARIERNL